MTQRRIHSLVALRSSLYEAALSVEGGRRRGLMDTKPGPVTRLA